jgi:hypothetical protein
MGLRSIHIFAILLLLLIFISLFGTKAREGMGSGSGTTSSYTGPAGDTVNTYSNTSQPATTDNTNNNYTQQSGGTAVILNTNANDDKYILKSQIVPPVCPACPSSSTCPRQEPCPSCPACARCPEAAFECKKVPNYKANDSSYLPRPVLNDFSSFGM